MCYNPNQGQYVQESDERVIERALMTGATNVAECRADAVSSASMAPHLASAALRSSSDAAVKASGRAHLSRSAWVVAARPRTLSLSTAPVILGAALACAVQEQIDWYAVSAAFIASAFIQLGTNLHNDAADFRRGGDGPDRVGPPRATASGVLDGVAVNSAAFGCFAVAALLGIYLIWLGGWPIFWLGVASILSGWAYTGGPVPIAYTPLGEAFVVAFFGLGAVAGTGAIRAS